MHRSYQSILPCHNKLLQQRWDTTYYNEHRRKVEAAVPVVDTKAPTTYMHLHLKLKKLQLEEERLATIERDNRILLEKMSYIMRTRGRIDNRNNYEYKSLNREKRQRELLRVTSENHEIMRRINMRKPEYSVHKWAEEWEENQKFMDSISAFPKDWWIQEDTKRDKSGQQSGVGKHREEGRSKSRDSQKKDKESRKDEEDREEQQHREKEKKEEKRKEQERKDREKKEKEEREKKEKEEREKEKEKREEEREKEEREKEEKEEREKEEREKEEREKEREHQEKEDKENEKEKEQTTTEESSDPEDSNTTQQKDSSEEQTADDHDKDSA